LTYSKWINKNNILVSSILFIVSLIYYVAYEFRFPLVYGIDGPYYLIQIEHIEKTGIMYYGDPPLTFYVLYAIYVIVHNSTLAVKIGSIVFSALTIFPLYYLLNNLLRKTEACIAAVFFMFSPHIIRLMGDFVKNTFGLFFLTSYLYFFNIWFNKKDRTYLLLSIVFLVLTGLTHILAFGILILYTFIYPVILYLNSKLKIEFIKALPLMIATITFSIISYTFFTFYFNDFGRIMMYIRSVTRPLLQQVHMESSQALAGIIRGPLLIYMIPSLMIIISITLLIVYELFKRRLNCFLLTSYIVCLILFNPLSNVGIFFRFVLSSIIPLSILAGYIVGLYSDRIKTLMVVFLILIPILLLSLQIASTWGPSIPIEMYSELKDASKYIAEANAIVHPIGIPPYWPEYVIGPERVIRAPLHPEDKPIYLVISKKIPLPPLRPYETIVFNGKYIQVRKIIVKGIIGHE